MWQAFSRDPITGAIRDLIPVSAGSFDRLLSARGGGSCTIPLDGSLSKAELRPLTNHWGSIITLEHDSTIQGMGYVTGRDYTRGTNALVLSLADVWAILARRGGWDHGAPNVAKWKTTVAGSRALHGAAVIARGRDTGPTLPHMGLPLTLPGGYTGPSVSRTYYGYHLEMVGDVLTKLMDEGLDVYFKPRRLPNGDADWLYCAADQYTSGVVREFFVTAPLSGVESFSESGDASRVTNNARRVGEGSEQDMKVRSNRDTSSPYPLLDRVTSVKTVKAVGQLDAMVAQDLAMYWRPTVQWEFQTNVANDLHPGDTVRLHFDGDPWIADGWHTRRVVKTSVTYGESMMTVTCQPTGGA